MSAAQRNITQIQGRGDGSLIHLDYGHSPLGLGGGSFYPLHLRLPNIHWLVQGIEQDLCNCPASSSLAACSHSDSIPVQFLALGCISPTLYIASEELLTSMSLKRILAWMFYWRFLL